MKYVNLIAMHMTFFKMYFWEFWYKLKSFNIERNESLNVPKMSKALIERFTAIQLGGRKSMQMIERLTEIFPFSKSVVKMFN